MMLWLLLYAGTAQAAWKTIALPFKPAITIEIPSEAKPHLDSEGEWYAAPQGGTKTLPGNAGFASASFHQFEENPLKPTSYGKNDSFESKVKDLAIAHCYFENADFSNYCPREEIGVELKKTKWGKAILVSGTSHARRGPVKQHFDPARMLVIQTKTNEGIVFRSLRGEIRDRLLKTLGFKQAH